MRSSQDDLRAFPEDARGEIGHSLYLVQCGDRPHNEKPLRDDLSSVSELVAESEDGNTYRSVFTVKLNPFIYVLHCFVKKATSGIATPKRELDLVRRRLKEAQAEMRNIRKGRMTRKPTTARSASPARSKNARSTPGSGNVFADLGFANADEMLAKAELVRRINKIIEEQGLTQAEAAKLLGVAQPRISELKRGRLTDFSIERLMRFLVALGQEVRINVRPASQAGLKVAAA